MPKMLIKTKGDELSARRSWEIPSFKISFWCGRQHKWCLVIPVINEGERLKSLLAKLGNLNIHYLLDIVIVDGGSTDETVKTDILKHHNVKGLLIKTGGGKLSAQLRCAYSFAIDHGYEGIITIDGNDKDDPKSIPSFINALEEGIDFAQASRFIPEGVAENTPRLRNIAIRYVHAPVLSLFSGFNWTDTTQGFRAYSRKMLLDSNIAPFRDIFATYELLAYLSYRAPKLGYRCIEIPTIRRYPQGQVPTKISSIKGNLSVFLILVQACLGNYNPRQ